MNEKNNSPKVKPPQQKPSRPVREERGRTIPKPPRTVKPPKK